MFSQEAFEGHCRYPKSEFKRRLGLECFQKVVMSQNAIAPMRKEAPGNETRWCLLMPDQSIDR